MCDICGRFECPASCPNHSDDMYECAVCGAECYGYEIDEELDDGTVICACCAAETDEDTLDEIRAAHRIPLAVQIRRWARL